MVNHSSRDEYKRQMTESVRDANRLLKTVDDLVDLPMYEFAKFCEDKNVGELKAFRSLMQTNLDQIDVYGKQLVDSKEQKFFSKEDRINLGSVFAISGKIQDRMGYMDYLVKKNQVL
jgi:hypothetical protein